MFLLFKQKMLLKTCLVKWYYLCGAKIKTNTLSNEEKQVENAKETAEEAKALKEEVKAREVLEAVLA